MTGATVYRPSPDESTSTAVVRAIADAKGVDPIDLDDRLYDYVDPGALDRLFATAGDSPSWDCRVSFAMAGCRVEVDAARRVVVTPEHGPTGALGEAAP